MIFRLYWELAGGHVHCKLFAGPHDGALGKCGEFTMREDEFSDYAFLHKATMQFRPTLGNVVPAYVIALDQDEIDAFYELINTAIDEPWSYLPELGKPDYKLETIETLRDKIEKYRSNR